MMGCRNSITRAASQRSADEGVRSFKDGGRIEKALQGKEKKERKERKREEGKEWIERKHGKELKRNENNFIANNNS